MLGRAEVMMGTETPGGLLCLKRHQTMQKPGCPCITSSSPCLQPSPAELPLSCRLLGTSATEKVPVPVLCGSTQYTL